MKPLLLGVLATLAGACGSAPLPAACPDWPNEAGAPRLVERADPTYPARALRDEISGYVDLDLAVDRAGLVHSASVVGSRPAGVFDASAREAILQWRYCPLPAAAPDYPSPVKVRIVFKMRE